MTTADIYKRKLGGLLKKFEGLWLPTSFQLKYRKKIGYIVKHGKKLVVPDLITIERTSNEDLKDVTSGQKTTISNIGLDMINKDLEGYHDAALGTIVFDKTKIPETDCTGL